MPETIEILPDQEQRSQRLFDSEEHAARFEEAFTRRVTPELEKAIDARIRSEQESRERLLR